jgi:hypothetical protein
MEPGQLKFIVSGEGPAVDCILKIKDRVFNSEDFKEGFIRLSSGCVPRPVGAYQSEVQDC